MDVLFYKRFNITVGILVEEIYREVSPVSKLLGETGTLISMVGMAVGPSLMC